MKFALYLILVLLTTVIVAEAESEEKDTYMGCARRCNRSKELSKLVKWICADSGKVYANRCIFQCSKLAPPQDWGDFVEVDCKPGAVEHCWNEECTEEEKKFLDEKDELCHKELEFGQAEHRRTNNLCEEKCYYKYKEPKELDLILCSELKKN